MQTYTLRSISNNLVEVEQKPTRPYVIIYSTMLSSEVAIPLRSNIKHPYYYSTQQGKKGLDYSKVIKGLDYSKVVIIGPSDTKTITQISQSEFNALKGKDKVVAHQFDNYVKDYIEAVKRYINGKNYQSDFPLMKYSTLQNYHQQLGL